MIYKPSLQKHFYFAGLSANAISPPQEDDVSRVFIVQGKKATSNEFYVAVGLDKVGLTYDFQLSFAGGKVAFGMVLDFMVHTDPLPTPVWVHGEHWHMGERKEKDLRQQAIVDELMGGMLNPPVVIWGMESNTESVAFQTVRRYFA